MYSLIEHLMDIPPANEMIPGIWVGNAEASMDPEFLNKNGIRVIINCTKNLPFTDNKETKYRYRVPVNDNLEKAEIEAMANFLGEIVKVIDTYYRKGHHILIHCAAGIQRSACVFLVYHIQYHSGDFQKSYKLMKSRRPWVFMPMMNFRESVVKYFREMK